MLKIENPLRVLEIYYSANAQIGTSEIKEIFSCHRSTAQKLKNRVKEEMKKRDIRQATSSTVNIDIAFEVWGIDIERIERNYRKLKKIQAL